jgi:hypothetical protein
MTGNGLCASTAKGYPFTEPAVRPVTKYRCSEKKMTSGRAIEMNAAAVIKCHPTPYAFTSERTITVMGAVLAPENTSATSRSFHTHMNWKIATGARAGVTRGRMMFQNDMLEITRRYKPPDEAEREHRELYARQQRVSIFLTPEKIITYGFGGHD